MVPYDAAQIERLAPAAPPGGCLLVDGSLEELRIWGFGRRGGMQTDGVLLEVPDPGTVRVGLGPYKTFAVFKRDSMSIVEGTGIDLQVILLNLLKKQFPPDNMLETQAVGQESHTLAELGRLILGDGHGGTVLIVPGEADAWSESLNPFVHRFATPDLSLHDAIRQNLTRQFSGGKMLEELKKAGITDEARIFFSSALTVDAWNLPTEIRRVASLARVDGALVITKDLGVLGFGAKIATEADVAKSVCIFRSLPAEQNAELSPISEVGGTRHQSAARFVAQNRDCVALVISQDRHMKVMHWWAQGDHVAVIQDAEWLV